MGNCTSKKSKKSAKLSALKKPIFRSEMNKDQDSHTKGLSIKIAPSTKGEITSYGFRKKPSSQLPIPVTLTSNGHLCQEPNEKMVQNGVAGVKNISDDYQSGSSVESLCHAPYRSTPKMIRKKDLAKQTININADTSECNSVNVNNAKNIKYTFQTNPTFRRNNGTNENVSKTEQTVNRFGFRQQTPPRASEIYGKASKNNAINRAIFLTGQDPYESGLYNTKKSDASVRSRSEGPRESFLKQTLQPANSIHSGLNNSKTSLSGVTTLGKFTFQTSQLPRPQFAVRMSDSKTLKSAANNYRKGGTQNELNSSKDSSTTEDSGFESYSSANNTLEKQILILDSSPGSKVRRRLPAFKGKKLEMKIVGNKFELLKKDEENSPDVVTEVSLIKLPTSNVRNSTAIINTGLVEQRTNQYLKKIQRSFNKIENDAGVLLTNRIQPKSNSKEIHSSNADEGLAAESEEEKLCKDSRKSEKSCVKYLMSDGCGEGDDILPGEAMAEDVSLCLSFEEETSSDCTRNVTQRPTFQPEFDVTPNTIRVDALKLSKEIKYKINAAGVNRKGENSTAESQNDYDKDEDTFPSDSILEQLSELDSVDEKREKIQIDKGKTAAKTSEESLEKEDLGIDVDEEESVSKSDTDVDENDLELNVDEKETKEENKNCLGTASPDSPGTPTHASNSLSLSDGRDFLIDDEIADQPQLCLSESYVDCSCQEEVKTPNEKTAAGSEFVTCHDAQTNTVEKEDEIERNEKEVEKTEGEIEIVDKPVMREGRARLNSDGTLSPCESIASDDLMLDFETNSFEESGRFDGESATVENLDVPLNKNESKESSNQRFGAGSGGGGRSLKSRGSSNCSTPAHKNVSSPLLSSRSTPAADDDSIRLDKVSYQNMFEDVASMKSMLLKLKRLLLESEGGLQENGRLYLEDGTGDHMVEEVTDLRRQVLFLQQQLEEREKMVQILRLEVTKSGESKKVPTAADDRKQTNAATQTGLDQFQQDFPHFRIFQTAPVV